MSHIFYPYRTAPERVLLRVEAPDHALATGPDGALVLAGLPEEQIRLVAQVMISGATLKEVLPPAERKAPPIRVLLRWKNIEGRQRDAVELTGSEVYEHPILLDRQKWTGTVEFQAVVVRKTRATETTSLEFGTEVGALLSWSGEVRVHLQDPPQPPGDFMEVVWVRFDQEARFARYESHLFALETRGPRPCLLLNAAYPGAHTILSNTARTGSVARVRDATYAMIVHQVWTSLLSSALMTLGSVAVERTRSAPDGGSPAELLAELVPWQRNVLQEWAPDLMDERNRETALTRLIHVTTQRDQLDELLVRRLPTVVQERNRTWRSLEGLIREISRR